ncbi:hypothetical protein BDB00DRAFT_418427 [Zychaea mexicana]|uniref:uncharacterized protein n=1 Tax=Zychaea mexicana TaxID=64656 RepID=UPI0022FE374F|nr:uncharacterized protein BDB00DRAFT_418427 [Zychaea mexicana]KAI9492822.1 hypothetical protein BDB00DRAFT_418427 [Zychaea mexicana]
MLTFAHLFPDSSPVHSYNGGKKKKQRRSSKVFSPFSCSLESTTSSASSSVSLSTAIRPQLAELPSEILLLIFNNLTVSDLITACSTSLYFYHIINVHHILADKLKESTLRLYFDQESRWRCALDMKLVRHDAHRFTFKPINQDTGFRMFSSRVLRDPSLYKVTLDGQNMMSTKRSTSLKIKSMIAYWKPLDAMADFVYSVHPTPAGWAKARPGERWMLPLLFECHPRWFMHHHHHHHHGYTSTKQLTHRVMEVFS